MNGIVKPKKRLFISLILVLSIAIASVISVAIVFAATLQNTNTDINITYIIDSVGAKISASYATVSSGTVASKTAITNSDGTSEIEIAVSDEIDLTNVTYDTTISTTLNSTTNKVVYEYKFTNTAESAFTVGLTNTISGTNISVAYKVSRTEIPSSNFSSAFEDISLMPQALVNEGDTIYIYVSATLTGTSATFSSNSFVWKLTRADDENIRTVTLNNGSSSTGGQTSLKFIYGTNIAMPILDNLPTPYDISSAFLGYYTGADGTGTQYIRADGTSAHASDLADGATLYAYFGKVYVIQNLAITDLTELGLSTRSLTIPNEITEISDNAFEGASAKIINYEGSGAETIAYADSTPLLTTIGANAFANCTNLKELYLPNTITSFSTTPLAGCSALEKIEFPYVLGDGTSSANGLSKLFGTVHQDIPKTLTTVIINGGTSIGKYAFCVTSYIKTVIISKSIKTIGEDAFVSTLIENIEFESGSELTSIGSLAFSSCSKLTKIIIPSSVTTIGDRILAACNNLESIEFPYVLGDGTSSANGLSKLFGTENSYIPTSLTTVVINGGRVIGDCAFHNCGNLRSITIPEGVTSIGDYAFYYCSNLKNVTIPNSITIIGGDAFYGCNNLSYSTYNNGRYLGNSKNPYVALVLPTSSTITSCEVNTNTKILCNTGFMYCTNLTSVIIPSGVICIGSKIFLYSTKLESIEFPYVLGDEGFSKLFYSSVPSTLTTVIINGGTRIGNSAFYNCSSITSITIPSSVTSIGYNAFSGCTNLAYNIYDNAKYLGNSQNKYHALIEPTTGVVTCEINSNTKVIADYAFQNCTGLYRVDIPSSVTNIGSYAFYNCTMLASITFEKTSNWIVSTSTTFSNPTTLTSSNLANTSTAATYLRSTYYTYYWKRTA